MRRIRTNRSPDFRQIDEGRFWFSGPPTVLSVPGTLQLTPKTTNSALVLANLAANKCISSMSLAIFSEDSPCGAQSAMARSVLIVDDNPLIREHLCELFKREADFDVCGEAENGQEAIEKAQQLHPDLIVMDLSMPVMNGLDAARVLRRMMPKVPVILFSAYGGQVGSEEAHSAGVSALVSKSEAVAILIAKARSLLNQIAA